MDSSGAPSEWNEEKFKRILAALAKKYDVDHIFIVGPDKIKRGQKDFFSGLTVHSMRGSPSQGGVLGVLVNKVVSSAMVGLHAQVNFKTVIADRNGNWKAQSSWSDSKHIGTFKSNAIADKSFFELRTEIKKDSYLFFMSNLSKPEKAIADLGIKTKNKNNQRMPASVEE